MRINHGDNPLDASTVHPAYPVVQRILAATERRVGPDGQRFGGAQPESGHFTDDKFGVPTVTDILKELEKPGRVRVRVQNRDLAEGVETLNDLQGMIPEGSVTNVTNFGAFVDIGASGRLVHISSLADKFVEDPHTVVKAGDIVKVKVMEVDLQRKRIALSMRWMSSRAKVHAPRRQRRQRRHRDNASRSPAPTKPNRATRRRPAQRHGRRAAAAFGKKR